tara:strand:- start:17787 stop:18434 length:648 start_codon:yes stop_codon:yes gene_type:complete
MALFVIQVQFSTGVGKTCRDRDGPAGFDGIVVFVFVCGGVSWMEEGGMEGESVGAGCRGVGVGGAVDCEGSGVLDASGVLERLGFADRDRSGGTVGNGAGGVGGRWGALGAAEGNGKLDPVRVFDVIDGKRDRDEFGKAAILDALLAGDVVAFIVRVLRLRRVLAGNEEVLFDGGQGKHVCIGLFVTQVHVPTGSGTWLRPLGNAAARGKRGCRL